MKKNFKIKMPDAYALLFMVAVFAALMTWVIPAGEYVRVADEASGRMIVDPASFHYIEASPVTFFGFFENIFDAFCSANEIIMFSMVISGVFCMIRGTGAIDAGVAYLVNKMRGKERLLIPVLVAFFSLFGCVMGSAEELLPFYPVVIPLAISLGFDALTGVAIVLLGAGAGFAGALMNPFTVGVAHKITGLPLYSGMGFRAVCYITLLLVTIIYIYRYAGKIAKDPSKSLMAGTAVQPIDFEEKELPEFTTRRKLIILIFALGLIWISYGVVKLSYYLTQLMAVFLIVAFASAIIAKKSPNEMAADFCQGLLEMTYGAFVIGVATAVGLMLQRGMIIDTVIHALASLIDGFAPAVSAVLMFLVQSVINFFVPSGSGQATVSMPIMGPLAEIVGLTRQTAVLAFQFGDGFSNVFYPTVGYMMAALAMGKVQYPVWVKFVWKLFVIWTLIGAIFVAIAATIGFGPF